MRCLICDAKFENYFQKNFDGEYNLNIVHYDKCNGCGLVVARELLEMRLDNWEKLNTDFHSSFLFKPEFSLDPKWNIRINNQVKDIKELYNKNILDANICLDYACGDGRLKERLEGGCGDKYIYCLGYDKYVSRFDSNIFLAPGCYDLVINTSYFEHVRHRDHLEEVNNLVSNNGTLALHTLVCEEVPKDPSWFYLVPVHSVVYTNKAMGVLFNQWGYKCCVYNPGSRMWFWFKQSINKKLLPDRFIYKDGFVDYWK